MPLASSFSVAAYTTSAAMHAYDVFKSHPLPIAPPPAAASAADPARLAALAQLRSYAAALLSLRPPGSRFKMAPTLSDDSAPCAALASPEAQSRPQQPQAAARQLGRQRSLMEGDERRPSK